MGQNGGDDVHPLMNDDASKMQVSICIEPCNSRHAEECKIHVAE